MGSTLKGKTINVNVSKEDFYNIKNDTTFHIEHIAEYRLADILAYFKNIGVKDGFEYKAYTLKNYDMYEDTFFRMCVCRDTSYVMMVQVSSFRINNYRLSFYDLSTSGWYVLNEKDYKDFIPTDI